MFCVEISVLRRFSPENTDFQNTHYYKRDCGLMFSTSKQNAKEHGSESYTVKIINNYFPLVAQDEELAC